MLYKRIVVQGTKNEPSGKPKPQFALPATVNWMSALATLADHHAVNFVNARTFYERVGRRVMDPKVENTVFEQLFLSLHHLSALEQMQGVGLPADLSRVGVLAWYYGLSNAASAMTAAQCDQFQEDHAGTARQWDHVIAAPGLAMEPFSWRVTNLLEKTFEPEVQAYKAGSGGTLQREPVDTADARGCAAEYLSGSAKWYVWSTCKNLRDHGDFKKLGVSTFRSSAAKTLRDKWLADRSVGFLHLASRYRGKANYREALFLGHGSSARTLLDGFVGNQAKVLRAFLAMAGAFSSRKLGKSTWDDFVADVDKNRAFTTSARSVWSGLPPAPRC